MDSRRMKDLHRQAEQLIASNSSLAREVAAAYGKPLPEVASAKWFVQAVMVRLSGESLFLDDPGCCG